MPQFLIYGGNGYTGSLIARAAAARGWRPILAGRRAGPLAQLAGALGFEQRVFALDDAAAIDEGLRGVAAVLHCAGPFSRTSKPMADACLRAGIHYLDITGEEYVFESLAARDAEAKKAGVMLLPGVGFDVVPSDCLAAHLKRRLPSAKRLALAFMSSNSGMSRGTALTVVEGMAQGSVVRQDGKLRSVPTAWKTRTIDFGTGPVKAVIIGWGDVSTAFHSTGIPNIEVYMAAPWSMRMGLRMTRYLGWLLSSRIVQNFLKKRVRAGPPGPTEEARARGQTYLWGEATDDSGRKVVSRLTGPEGYNLTARAALAVVERVLAGHAPPGFQTPSTAYGPDFVMGLEGVVRLDEKTEALR